MNYNNIFFHSFSEFKLYVGLIKLNSFDLDLSQVDIVNICQKAAKGPAGFYRPSNPSGDKFPLHMMCFGRNWDPVTKYEESCRSDGLEPPPVPFELLLLAERTIKDFERNVKNVPPTCPYICLANFYSTDGRHDLHQVSFYLHIPMH